MNAPQPPAALPTSLALAVLLSMSACGTSSEDLPRSERLAPGHNVLLISLDTLRRDHVGAYVAEKNTTPNLDAFAAKSLRFDQAFSHHPWTLTSHATMLSGLFPSVHDVLTDRALNPAVHTMAEVFSEAGLATIGIVDSCKWVDPEFGFDQGFGTYQVMDTAALPKIERLFTMVDSLDEQPFFAFLHLFDAHSDFRQLPYDSQLDIQEQYAGWYTGDFDGSLPEHPDWGHSSDLLRRMNTEGVTLEGDDRQYLIDLYDAGVRSLDASLGKLFQGLEQRGLLENTVIAVVADHGEELYEHGRSLHTGQYDELLRIPFLLFVPHTGPSSSSEMVGLIDLAPTLLELAGLSIPQDMQGRSLAPLTRGEALADPRDLVLLDNSMFLGFRSRTEAGVFGSDGFGLFDMQKDPEQQHNLIQDPAWSERLEQLITWLKAEREAMQPLRERLGAIPGSVALDEDDREDLQKLGYAGD